MNSHVNTVHLEVKKNKCIHCKEVFCWKYQLETVLGRSLRPSAIFGRFLAYGFPFRPQKFCDKNFAEGWLSKPLKEIESFQIYDGCADVIWKWERRAN